MHILPNIWRSKSNQTTKFGQLIEYNMRHTLAENSYTKLTEKLFPDSFVRNQNWVYLWISSLKVSCSLFLLYVYLRAIEV